MTVFDKFRNCITEPRCRDCEGIPGVCEYDHQSVTIPKVLALDVLNKLKEQEPKLIKIDGNSVLCPTCGNELFTYPQQKFCDECGQEVKWE